VPTGDALLKPKAVRTRKAARLVPRAA
jgi:hypothetical protein